MKQEGLHNKQHTSDQKTLITPKEFVHLWNILLTATKKAVVGDADMPCIIISFDFNERLANSLYFIIDRINNDAEFQKEIERRTTLSIEVGDSINIIGI